MDPYEIEDTSDWEGCPTRLETVKHYASMLEEDIQALRLELRAAKENISGLVQMNDQLSSDLTRARTWLANREAETTVQLGEIQSLTLVLSQKERIIRELQARMPIGDSPLLHKPRTPPVQPTQRSQVIEVSD